MGAKAAARAVVRPGSAGVTPGPVPVPPASGSLQPEAGQRAACFTCFFKLSWKHTALQFFRQQLTLFHDAPTWAGHPHLQPCTQG